jgi:hypothetical protein
MITRPATSSNTKAGQLKSRRPFAKVFATRTAASTKPSPSRPATPAASCSRDQPAPYPGESACNGRRAGWGWRDARLRKPDSPEGGSASLLYERAYRGDHRIRRVRRRGRQLVRCGWRGWLRWVHDRDLRSSGDHRHAPRGVWRSISARRAPTLPPDCCQQALP